MNKTNTINSYADYSSVYDKIYDYCSIIDINTNKLVYCFKRIRTIGQWKIVDISSGPVESHSKNINTYNFNEIQALARASTNWQIRYLTTQEYFLQQL